MDFAAKPEPTKKKSAIRLPPPEASRNLRCGECLFHAERIVSLDWTKRCPRCGADYSVEKPKATGGKALAR